MLRPNKVIVHHSLTADSITVSWGAIRKYHVETCGWNEIGYHAGVELVGSGGAGYYEALFGRDWWKTGAHTIGQNEQALGICFVGNYDLEVPPYQMLLAGAKVIAAWVKWLGVPPGAIFPHNAFASYKTCPGTQFPMDSLKSLVSDILEAL